MSWPSCLPTAMRCLGNGGLLCEQVLAGRRLVEGEQVSEILDRELRRIDLRHLLGELVRCRVDASREKLGESVEVGRIDRPWRCTSGFSCAIIKGMKLR